MKTTTLERIPQPTPVTPGMTKAMVREHAYQMYRDRLPDTPLTIEDWVLAEKDLVARMQDEQPPTD
ncbi:MAG: hypothetical protein H7A45_01230 [Verrucomicrobiales bacterium]|nr:hypothetical protein [Verrucomicrobiales bacterium]